MRWFVLVPTLVLTGCDLVDALIGTDDTTDATTSTSTASTATEATATEPTPPSGTTTSTPGTGTVGGDDEEWSFSQHPCFGNRTDTMWFDDPSTVWVGCGSTTEGTGLFVSVDGGQRWHAPDTTPSGYFDTFRVDSISRSSDGLLYVAGIDTAGAERVVSLDQDGVVAEVFAAGNQVWNSFQVGTFRRNDEGLSVAESLTGSELVARFGDDQPFADASGWAGSGSYQILDLVLFDDRFYAVGSTIGQPPTVFLPPVDGQDPHWGFELDPVEFFGSGVGAFDGELWGLDVDEGGLVAAGTNEDRDTGVVLWSGADPQDLEGYHALDVGSLYPSDPTFLHGACRNRDILVAVGEFSHRETGLVLRSDDDGAHWQDITPSDDLPPVSRCEVFDDGSMAIAGGQGLFAVYTPR